MNRKIKDEWEEFSRKVISPKAPDEQVQAMRLAFYVKSAGQNLLSGELYAGVQASFTFYGELSEQSHVDESSAVKSMQDLGEEIGQFWLSLKAEQSTIFNDIN